MCCSVPTPPSDEGTPLMLTEPDVGLSEPEIRRNSDDFPHADRPTNIVGSALLSACLGKLLWSPLSLTKSVLRPEKDIDT
mmetsp:Transcript_23748/g.51444  ORF Transcript_23748/g.51444 Transcript_23748/m.51444 type:complete len:80 (+) Transcript_23748:546-785(+)